MEWYWPPFKMPTAYRAVPTITTDGTSPPRLSCPMLDEACLRLLSQYGDRAVARLNYLAAWNRRAGEGE